MQRTDRRSNSSPAGLERWREWIRSDPQEAPNRGQQARAGCGSRRVLLVSYQFPPTGGSGVQRPAKLAKYLPACGWSVEVLAAGHDRFCWTDASLLTDLPAEVLTHRIAGWEPACVAGRIADCWMRVTGTNGRKIQDALHWRLTRLADRLGLDSGGESLWVGLASRAAVARHRVEPFDAVISTGPPHFAHRVALRIARATGLSWLADLRDPLVSDFDRVADCTSRNRRGRRLERAIMTHADRIVTTCPAFARDLQERYPDRTEHISSITNGFDRDDIRGAVDIDSLPTASADMACTFVVAGSFYGRRELARIIGPLQQVLVENPSWSGRVELLIAGTIDAEQQRSLREAAPPWVKCLGYLEHAEAIRLAAAATCNLIVVPACEHGRHSIPGKTFELLALSPHILALVPPESDTARIVNGAGNATVVPFEDGPQIAAAMAGVIKAHFDGRLADHRDYGPVDAFDRRVIARCLADALDEMRRKSSRGHFQSAAEVA
jgi:glycosyltransferase involved in cell wall biosynthesis